jgi:hypothetical protein
MCVWVGGGGGAGMRKSHSVMAWGKGEGKGVHRRPYLILAGLMGEPALCVGGGKEGLCCLGWEEAGVQGGGICRCPSSCFLQSFSEMTPDYRCPPLPPTLLLARRHCVLGVYGWPGLHNEHTPSLCPPQLAHTTPLPPPPPPPPPAPHLPLLLLARRHCLLGVYGWPGQLCAHCPGLHHSSSTVHCLL